MKISSRLKKLFLPLIISTLFLSKPCYSWDGYDHDNATSIDIGQGNLVREGLTIEYYDWKDDEYYTAKIILLDYESDGTKLVVEDLETAKKRTFIMED